MQKSNVRISRVCEIVKNFPFGRKTEQFLKKKFDNDTMTEIHKNLPAKYKGDLNLRDTPLSFKEQCPTRLIRLMTDEDKLKDLKKAVEQG